MPNEDENRLIREATDIFLRLRDAPDDTDLQHVRDGFLSRGPAERQAYEKMLTVWQVTETGGTSRPKILPMIFFAVALGAGAYWASGPVRVMLFADIATGAVPEVARLASGDRVTLDAGSALIDDTDGGIRGVTLMQGAAFFDVTRRPEPFVVTVDDLQISVTGTAFEAGHLADGAVVSVTEGAVTVTYDDESWNLAPGDRLLLDADTGGIKSGIDPDTVASWRGGLLVADGLTFGQITDIIDRRLSGDVIITEGTLADTPIVGTFDLTDPLSALKLLAELEGATLTTIPSIVTVIRR